jgi:hypothetical protein
MLEWMDVLLVSVILRMFWGFGELEYVEGITSSPKIPRTSSCLLGVLAVQRSSYVWDWHLLVL